MLLKTSRAVVLFAVTFTSFVAAANGTDSEFACPKGTIQRGSKAAKSESLSCVRSASVGKGEPRLHGPYIDFHANGQKQSEGQYVDGARSGRWTFWDSNGVKSGETEFSGGNYHGERIQYFANGSPRMIEHYSEGKRNGFVQEYSEDGKMVRQVQYADDRQVAAK